MIFKFAVKLESRESGHNWVGCYFDAEGKISRWQRHSFVHCEDKLLMALSLPGVCRQIYTETATLLFSQNTFAFDSEFSMDSWLNRRLIAQRESIKYLILPKYVRVDYHTWEDVDITEELTARVRETCPNLVELIGGNECEDLKNMVYGPNSADPLNWSFAFLRGSG